MTATETNAWFADFAASPRRADLIEHPIAYFCAEYALEDRLRSFAGGLGVLAGDVIRESADRNVPLVAVGLYYRRGAGSAYPVAADTCDYAATDPAAAGLMPVLGPDRTPITIKIPIYDRKVAVRAWLWSRGDVSVYLLDVDNELNTPVDRAITSRLYVGDKETRLLQEVVLGIGGLRLLAALGIRPSIHHLNEGHSALLSYELTRLHMTERGIGFTEAQESARRQIVFTNHTLVPAGDEVFSNDLVSLVLDGYAKEIGVPIVDLVRLGLVQQSSQFSMTMLALRMSSTANAVSRLHATKAGEIWTDHPMAAVTNGVHVPTWDALGAAGEGDDRRLWETHLALKKSLLAAITSLTGRQWGEDDLLIGWGRRFASYKRPLAAFGDIARLSALARAEGRRVRFVFSGKAHPEDTEGADILNRLCDLVDGDIKDIACVMPRHNLATAKALVSGCDVWLNTPVVGFEACGTSGMKAALNGVLPCSTKDGWMDEVDLPSVGWTLDSNDVTRSLLDTLERDIVPTYYGERASGVPVKWVGLMRNARRTILNDFSASRMLKEYLEKLYA